MIHDVPSRPLRVCVFGGARPGRPEDRRLAEAVGALLGARGHELIYGAGGVGVMGAVAWAAADADVPVTGVIPEFLRRRERHQLAPTQQTVVTRDLFDRKRVMLERADAFLVLPGGIGTLDEILEVISMQALDVTGKPLVLLRADGLWDRLVQLLDDLAMRGYADALAGASLVFADTAEEAVAMVERSARSADAALVGVSFTEEVVDA